MKKLAAMAGAAALLLGATVPALAHPWHWHGGSDVAIVENSASAVANTGENGQGNAVLANGGHNDDTTVSGNNYMSTGGADAYAGALVVANTHIGCGPCASGGPNHRDFAMVGNGAYAVANTGENGQGNAVEEDGGHNDDTTVGGDNTMVTGGAVSTARAWTVVNTHWGGSWDLNSQ